MAVSYVTLYSKDVSQMQDWYTSLLSLNVLVDSGEFILLGKDGQNGGNLGIHKGTPLDQPERVQLHFEVDDVDTAFESISNAGATVRQEPKDMPWGYRVAAFADPEGHTVEIFRPVDQGGAV